MTPFRVSHPLVWSAQAAPFLSMVARFAPDDIARLRAATVGAPASAVDAIDVEGRHLHRQIRSERERLSRISCCLYARDGGRRESDRSTDERDHDRQRQNGCCSPRFHRDLLSRGQDQRWRGIAIEVPSRRRRRQHGHARCPPGRSAPRMDRVRKKRSHLQARLVSRADQSSAENASRCARFLVTQTKKCPAGMNRRGKIRQSKVR